MRLKLGMLLLIPLILGVTLLVVLGFSLFSPPSYDSYSVIHLIRRATASFTTEVIGPILKFIDTYWNYFPLAAIGIWRWAVWILKKICSYIYSPICASIPPYHDTITIITPVYNENPDVFRRALYSWEANRPDELVAVIDQSDTRCIKVFEEFSLNKSWTKLIVTHKPGKRRALVDGILKSNGNILALVDSDTIWGEDIKDKVLAPFVDPKIGGVTTKNHPIELRSLWQKMTDIFWDLRNYQDLPSQTAMGMTMTCLTGRTSFYRREVLLPKLDLFLNEVILGRKKESGEDKCLTRIAQQQGWKTYYQSNAVIYSSAPLDFKTFWGQRLRWSRNSHNSDLISLWQGWAWKHPFLAFYMVDRFISIFTLFLGPIFLGISIYLNQWLVSVTIVSWWLIGRGIRIIPHLRRKPRDLYLVPVYIGINFLNALIKLYALVTIREQKVIRELKQETRIGNKSAKRIKNVVLTAEIISTLVILVTFLR